MACDGCLILSSLCTTLDCGLKQNVRLKELLSSSCGFLCTSGSENGSGSKEAGLQCTACITLKRKKKVDSGGDFKQSPG